ncbi:MAG: ATP12 family chaperone protein, partial [Pseudomonadota bacterium]
MSLISAKRFWTQASTVPAPGGFAVHLDARPLRTPAKAPLVVPVAPWADAIAAEWDAQGEIIEPTSMPFTQMANVAIDRVGLQRAEVAEMLAAYGASDLLCYRADQPQGLVARQTDQWNPWLEWAKTTLDAPLRSTAGIVPIAGWAMLVAATAGLVVMHRNRFL